MTRGDLEVDSAAGGTRLRDADEIAKLAGRSLWRNRAFVLLWSTEMLSDAVQHAIWYGIVLLVLRRSDSAALLGLAVATLLLPSVVVTLPAGVLLDRADPRRVLLGANTLRALLALTYATFAGVEALPLALLFLVNLVYASINQLFAAGEETMLPAIVPREQLMQANGVFHLSYSAAQLGGFVVLGPLLARLVGTWAVFVMAALVLGICVVLSYFLPVDRRRRLPRETAEASGLSWRALVRQDLEVARTYLIGQPVLQQAMLRWTAGACTGLIVATLAPSFVERALSMPAENVIVVLAPAGLGLIAGTLALGRWGRAWESRRIATYGLVATALSLVVIGASGAVLAWLTAGAGAPSDLPFIGPASLVTPLVMVLASVVGLSLVAIMVPSQTLLQAMVPEELRGRLFALQLLFGNLASLLPLFLLGALADRIGPERTLLLAGLAVGTIACYRPAQKEPPRDDRDPGPP